MGGGSGSQLPLGQVDSDTCIRNCTYTLIGARAHVRSPAVPAGNPSYVQTSAREDSRRINAHATTPCIYPIYIYIYCFSTNHLEKVARTVKEVGLSAVRQSCQQGPLSPPFPSKSHRSWVAGGAALGARAAPAARARAPGACTGAWRAAGSAARSGGAGGGRLRDVFLGFRLDQGKCPRGPGRLDPQLRYLTPRFRLVMAGPL